MATSLVSDESEYPTDTRHRILETAKTLISQNGYAGTSLQMIADELGFTKAAIYYHFRTRDQLLIAIMDPFLKQIREVVEFAENQRTAGMQTDAMVQGYARVVAIHRSLAAVMVFDPSVHRMLQSQPVWGDLIGRQLALLVHVDAEATEIIKATALLTGLAGAATGAPHDIDEQELTEELAILGRRTMGLRQPRRRSDSDLKGDPVAPNRHQPASGRWNDVLPEA